MRAPAAASLLIKENIKVRRAAIKMKTARAIHLKLMLEDILKIMDLVIRISLHHSSILWLINLIIGNWNLNHSRSTWAESLRLHHEKIKNQVTQRHNDTPRSQSSTKRGRLLTSLSMPKIMRRVQALLAICTKKIIKVERESKGRLTPWEAVATPGS